MDNIVPLNLNLDVESDSAMLKRRGLAERCVVPLPVHITTHAVSPEAWW